MAGERRILTVSDLFLSLSALAATFQCSGFLLSLLMIQSLRQRQVTVTWSRPRLGGLPHLESFTWQNATPADRVTLPGRAGNPPRLPHLPCKHDHIKIRDYMEKRVTSPTWGPPPPCKQAFKGHLSPFCVCAVVWFLKFDFLSWYIWEKSFSIDFIRRVKIVILIWKNC